VLTDNAQPTTEVAQNSQTAKHPDSFSSRGQSFRPVKANPLSVLIADWQTIYQRDPAARNWLEVLLCYPGLHALWCHRVAHWLHGLGIPFLPRFLSFLSRLFTGIEIHPGAKIGKGLFIDHGMGVVIGETAVVGDYVLIYQGATLGGTGKEKGKRHPTLGNNVVVGAGAKVLGNIQIGDNVRIGAGSVVLRDVPSNSTVVGVPGRITRLNGVRADALAHNNLRDVEAEVIRALFERVKELEKQVVQLQGQFNLPPMSVDSEKTESEKCYSNGVIEDFLDGAGI
jgi:serine O-acetyltransferase